MTTKQNNNDRAYGALWFPKSTTGAAETLRVRVLHASVNEFLQTSTHWVFFEKKAGGRGNIRVECKKQGTFGTTRDGIECPLDAGEKYGAPKNKQWFWVEDLDDGGLKYVEMPYSIRQKLEVMQTSAFRGQPLYEFELQFIKSGKGLNTDYQIMPESLKVEGNFSLQSYLADLGLDSLPPLVGTENFPPIWSLDDEGLENAARGIMPWQGGGKSAPGTPAQDVEAYNPYGNPEPLTPAPAQAQAPAQTVAQPNLQAVESDDLPVSMSPAPSTDLVEEAKAALPEVTEVEEDELEVNGKKVFF